jgi:hypothetical protein
MNAKLNRVIPNRTNKEYTEDHKEHHNEWRIANKDKIRLQRQQHYQENKEQIKERVNNYRMNNREKIRELHRQECICEVCGVKYTRTHRTRHERSNRHQKAVALQNNVIDI